LPENNGRKKSSVLLNSEKEPLLSENNEDSEVKVLPTLHDITLTVKTGMTIGVCGSVGSGKTSVLQAILGMV